MRVPIVCPPQDAKKGVLFIDFPPVLQLQLKRFEYDFMRDTMVKVRGALATAQHCRVCYATCVWHNLWPTSCALPVIFQPHLVTAIYYHRMRCLPIDDR